jgi:hypothetical protein
MHVEELKILERELNKRIVKNSWHDATTML